jgi:hypothetical protein
MIPIGVASNLLSGVSDAISSELSKLTGKSPATEAEQPSFAAHLKAATSQSSLGESAHHHHAHGAQNKLANSSSASSQIAGSGTTSGSAVGSVINTIV